MIKKLTRMYLVEMMT